MDAARWERLQSLFHRAADLAPGEQSAFVRAACAGDEELAEEALAMLAHDARGVSLLDRDVAEAADQVLADDVPNALATQAFGPYRLVRLLGSGGMAVVYLAVRDDLGSTAAIKILRDAWLSPARRDRFASEQRILAQLNHPSIARLYDADTLADGTPWFAMECVEGVPLTEYCRAHDLSIDERLRLFRTVCDAVQYAHRHLIVHRDLKPSNILVTADGGVKLLDFGISKPLDGGGADQTQAGLRLMTPAYAAPEQIRGGATGVHTDVHALGVILYELLTGGLPFDLAGRTPAEAERILLEAEPSRPSIAGRARTQPADGRRVDWPDLDVLCLTAMHRDPARRYGSVEALIRDVDRYLRREPLEARPDNVRYKWGKFVARHRRPLAAAAATLIVVVSMVAFYTVRLATARNAAIAESIRTQRIQRFMLTLFDSDDREAAPADDLRVLTLVDRGRLEAQSLDREPLVQAELFQTLGGIYEKLGKFAQAESLLTSSLDRRRALLGPQAPEVVRGMVALGRLRSDQARFDEAERLVRDAQRIARAHPSSGDASLATATAALGEILEQRGAYDEAIGVLTEAAQLQSAPGIDQSELPSTLFELASTHFYAGHFDVSESITQRALTMHRQRHGERHPLVAEDLINLGAIQHERGRYVEAERLYRQALEINRAWYGADSYRTASNLTMLARALEFEERYDESEALLRQALAIHERVFGLVHPRVASVVNDLGNLAMRRGHAEEAEPYFRRIGDIYRQVYGDKHYLVALAISNLAGVYMARADYATAERMYREAVGRFTEAQSPQHVNTGIARIKLGRALLRLKRYADAERESLGGYRILAAQMAPTVTWLKSAREDLVEIYVAIGQPDKAEPFRAEAARVAREAQRR